MPADFASAFVTGRSLVTRRGPATVDRVWRCAEPLIVGPAQALVVCDPHFVRSAAPLARRWDKALTGAVFAPWIRGPELGMRVPCALAAFTSDEPVPLLARVATWELAHFEERTAARFGVDYGWGCFADPTTTYLLKGRPDAHEQLCRILAGGAALSECISLVAGTIALPVFETGMGDGSYACYFGLDGGEPLCLVADFEMLEA